MRCESRNGISMVVRAQGRPRLLLLLYKTKYYLGSCAANKVLNRPLDLWNVMYPQSGSPESPWSPTPTKEIGFGIADNVTFITWESFRLSLSAACIRKVSRLSRTKVLVMWLALQNIPSNGTPLSRSVNVLSQSSQRWFPGGVNSIGEIQCEHDFHRLATRWMHTVIRYDLTE